MLPPVVTENEGRLVLRPELERLRDSEHRPPLAALHFDPVVLGLRLNRAECFCRTVCSAASRTSLSNFGCAGYRRSMSWSLIPSSARASVGPTGGRGWNDGSSDWNCSAGSRSTVTIPVANIGGCVRLGERELDALPERVTLVLE